MICNLIQGLNKEEKVIFDIGANIGFISIHLAYQFLQIPILLFRIVIVVGLDHLMQKDGLKKTLSK